MSENGPDIVALAEDVRRLQAEVDAAYAAQGQLPALERDLGKAEQALLSVARRPRSVSRRIVQPVSWKCTTPDGETVSGEQDLHVNSDGNAYFTGDGPLTVLDPPSTNSDTSIHTSPNGQEPNSTDNDAAVSEPFNRIQEPGDA